VRNILNCILTLSSERKITFGGRKYVAPYVQGVWQAMDKEGEEFA